MLKTCRRIKGKVIKHNASLKEDRRPSNATKGYGSMKYCKGCYVVDYANSMFWIIHSLLFVVALWIEYMGVYIEHWFVPMETSAKKVRMPE